MICFLLASAHISTGTLRTDVALICTSWVRIGIIDFTKALLSKK
jgi:hypothetical protein